MCNGRQNNHLDVYIHLGNNKFLVIPHHFFDINFFNFFLECWNAFDKFVGFYNWKIFKLLCSIVQNKWNNFENLIHKFCFTPIIATIYFLRLRQTVSVSKTKIILLLFNEWLTRKNLFLQVTQMLLGKHFFVSYLFSCFFFNLLILIY